MSGGRVDDLLFIAGVAVAVVAIIAALCWLGDREVTRGRR